MQRTPRHGAEAGPTAVQEQEPSGTGFNIDLHALPLDGRLVLFPPNEDAGT
jgi:hypothetical protein